MSSPSLEVSKQSLAAGAREEIPHHTGLEQPGTANPWGLEGHCLAGRGCSTRTPVPQMIPDPSIPEGPLRLSSEQAQKSPFSTPPPPHVLVSQKITERFFRNPAKPADEDVAERVFLIAEERIQLRYHCRSDHITANKREFLRRMEVDSKGNKIIMTPDMCISFEVGSGVWREGAGWGGVKREPWGPPCCLGDLGELGWKTLVPSLEIHLHPWENQDLPSGNNTL